VLVIHFGSGQLDAPAIFRQNVRLGRNAAAAVALEWMAHRWYQTGGRPARFGFRANPELPGLDIAMFEPDQIVLVCEEDGGDDRNWPFVWCPAVQSNAMGPAYLAAAAAIIRAGVDWEVQRQHMAKNIQDAEQIQTRDSILQGIRA
jgi:hypothetical protein